MNHREWVIGFQLSWEELKCSERLIIYFSLQSRREIYQHQYKEDCKFVDDVIRTHTSVLWVLDLGTEAIWILKTSAENEMRFIMSYLHEMFIY